MTLPLLMVALYLLAAAAAVAPTGRVSRWASAAASALGSVVTLAIGVEVLWSGAPGPSILVPSSLPFLTLSFRPDPLAAFFLVLIGIVAAPSALYGAGYTRDGAAGTRDAEGHRHSSRLSGVMLPLFLLSMSLVSMADNVFSFLLTWEAMSLSSYFLVVEETGNEENLLAGRWYAGMAHAGFALIAVALLVLGAATAGGDFGAIRQAAPALGPLARNVVFLLALAGFGSKAGLVPLHVWLPRAHPAAPSHASALMSGVMLKLGVYGILRVGLDLLGGGPSWWGTILLVLGAASALLGVLYALMEHDLKRLLAYSSVENVGLVCLALGLGFIFRGAGLPDLAGLALAAALFHALNHAAFKGLLFLGAGAVQRAAGTRDIEKMGGLIRGLPQTAACFLVGSAAISALPPLNGFASEWLIFQSLLQGVRVREPLIVMLMALGVGALALTSGLAAACFVRAFGVSFLALPRSPGAAGAREVDGSMRVAMMALAAACVALGVLPSAAIRFLAPALTVLSGVGVWNAPGVGVLTLAGAAAQSRVSPMLLMAGLAAVLASIPIGLRIAGASRRTRRGDTWGCGRLTQSPRMEYTSAAFAEPLRRVFAGFYRPTKDLAIGFHPESKYFVRRIEYHAGISAWFEDLLYRPLFAAVRAIGGAGRFIQSGSVHLYIGYIIATLMVLLVLARWWS